MERQNGNSTAVHELRAGREACGSERGGRTRRIFFWPSSIGIVIKLRVTMREKLNVV